MAASGSQNNDFGAFVKTVDKRLNSIERHKHAGMLPVQEGSGNTPNPPTWVRWDRVIVDGKPATHTVWDEPTTNTDGSELTDLFRYEVQQQIGYTLSWGDPTEVAPAKSDSTLNRLMDRNGMGEGWTGGDGGASHRDDQGFDWWFWSDSNWGELRADGSTKTWIMLRNSLTRTRGTDRNSMVMKVGRENQFPGLLTATQWQASDATLEEVEGGVRFTATSSSGFIMSPQAHRLAVEPGDQVTWSVHVDAPVRYARVRWMNGSSNVTPADDRDAIVDDGNPILTMTGTAPEGATHARLLIGGYEGQAVTVTKVYVAKGDVPMASWRNPVQGYDFTNLMHDPEGRGGSSSHTPVEVWRNLALNPSFEGDDRRASLYSGATAEIVESASAWVGQRVLRVNKGNAGSGNVVMFDYAGGYAPVAPGDTVRYRLRVRRGSLTNPDSRLAGRLLFYNGTSRRSPDAPSETVTLSAEWTEYVFEGVVPDDANKAALMIGTSGPAWSAADWFEVDGREMYVNTDLPASYFDGSTPSGDGFEYGWDGAVHDSASVMSTSNLQRRNVALFPEDLNTERWYSASGGQVSLDYSDTPGGGTGVVMPEVVNPGALTTVRNRLRNSPGSITGIGVLADSTGETAGSQSNPNLKDRYVETLQRELRRRLQSSGVEVDPAGYYGATSYVAARFQQPGPVDWVVRGPSVEFVDMGAGGRGFGLPYGSSAHLRATFNRATVELPSHSWGRVAVISVDGVERARIDTYSGSDDLIQWDTGDLGYGEHLISVESSRLAGSTGGEVRVSGAMLFDNASASRGVRVYDLSCGGRALDDLSQWGAITSHSLRRPMNLLIYSLDFNDAGRGITPAQHKANYKAQITRQRLSGYDGPTLLMAKWTPSTVITSQWPAPMDEYRQAMREVAQEDPNVAFIDLGEVFPTPDEDESLFDDWVHQNEIGNQRIAAVLLELLNPSEGDASIRVRSAADLEGVQFATFASGAFDKQTSWTFSVSVKGPAGRQVRPRLVQSPTVVNGAAYTLTGEWQRISITAPIGADASPRLQIGQADSAGAMEFRVARPLVEEGTATRDYFSWQTPDTEEVDYRQLIDGSSIAVGYSPMLWVPDPRTTVRYTREQAHGFGGSVRVEALAAEGGAGVTVHADSAGGPSGDLFTLVGWVRGGPGVTEVTATALVGGSPDVSQALTVLPEVWTEFRLPVAADGSPVTGVHLTATSGAGRTVFHATEITLAEGEYTAPAFSGNSKGSHAHSVWNGTPFASTSTLTMSNTDFAHTSDQNTSLIVSEVFDLEGWKFLWSQGAIGDGNTGLMFLQTFFHRPISDESGWNFHRYGDIVVARFDLESERLVDTYVLEAGADAQWGEGLWVEDGWLYVYGGTLPGDGTGSVVLRRYPAERMHDRLVGHGQTWTSSGWGGEFDEPAPVANLPIEGGFSAVRPVGNRWVALYTAGGMNHLQSWEASQPQGPFAPADVVMPYPDDGVNRYVPRFHPQFDSGQKGISIAICESGEGKYRPLFLRGPAGERNASFDDAFWGHVRYVEDPEHYQIPVALDEPYAVRVRAVDKYGNASEWAVGEETGEGPEMPEVPKPSTPTATAFFRGGRIFWDGLTEHGEPYEDFHHYEVHISSAEDFEPNNWTRVDASVTQGGVSPISVEDYATRYVIVIVEANSGARSEPSDPAAFSPERLSDPDLGQTLIDGARLRPGTVNASALTVGSFTDNLLLNSNFEQPSLEDPTKPSMWAAGWPRGDFGDTPWEEVGHWERSEEDAVGGSASLRIDTYETMWTQVISDPPIPVLPGDIYYVAARVRTDGIDGDIEINLIVGETEGDVNGFGTPSQQTLLVGRTAGGQTTQVIEGPVEIPDKFGDGSGVAMHFAAVSIEARATGREYTTWIDDVEVRRVFGEAAIADASINRAKIRYLAVDDARIANVGVGKLVAGELFADITVSARIMTARTGKRWEANIDGAYTFNPDLTSGNDQTPITEMRATDGGLISRWFRTNTTGTRIEMGSYSMGGNSALMSFHPTGTAWQFPPAVGFGGDFRQGSIPGIGIHAGSYTEDGYQNYGMNMMAVDQVGGITMTTGNLLNGRESDYGAPIRMSAGGGAGVIDIRSGTLFGTGANDRARIYLSPSWPGRDSPPGVNLTRIDLNYGTINFLPAGTSSNVSIRHVFEGEWAPTPYYHVLLSTASGGFRIATSATSEALIVSPFGILQGAGWDYAVKLGTEGTGQNSHFATIRYDGSGSPAIRVYNGPAGAMVASKTFVIDHPVREDEYLVHAAVEGPTADVFYRGESRLVEGRATVVLPDYFEALTVPGSATVHVTPIVEDGVMPSPLAATRVAGDRFVVMGTDYASFFWEVKAERARTQFATEPRKDEVRLKGDGPYTYLEPLS